MAYPISDVPRRIVYSGSAGVGPYAFTFEVLAATDIAVYKNTTLLTLTTDYTVSINTGTGTGTVTLVVAATGADTVTIVGDRAIQRTSDFVTGGDLFANTLNNELDAQTIYTQQVDEKADRAIRSPVTDPTTISMVLPSQASRAQKLLGFNASGEPTTYVATTTVSDTSLINFTQAGTGAVTRTAQSKMREVVSVKDFGAVGDGVADDTAAIQAAINYCTNLSNRKQTLYFPATNAAATYRITSSLTISGRLNIVGDGEFSTTIYASGFSAGQYILNFDNLDADVVYFGGVQQITLLGSNTNARGIRLNNASYWTLKNVQLNTLGVGVYITGTRCFSNFFEQVTGYGISSYTVQFDNFTGGGQYEFLGCTFTGSDGFYLTSTAATDSLVFYNCNFEQCVTTDLYINGTVQGLTISGCRSEGLNGAVSFLIDPASGKFVRGVSITSCFWASDSGNAYPIQIGGSGGDIKGFNISGNYAGYIGLLGFVNLNGAGEAGVISGNYCENSPTVVNAARAGTVVFANYNSSGALPDYWGTATWKVEQGSYTGTGTGFTSTPTGTIKYSIVGNTVTLDIAQIAATSNSADFTITGMPVAIRPATQKQFFTAAINNGGGVMARVRVETSGVITVYSDLAGNGFVASGTKGLEGVSISYTLA